jgi:hypothetical protein
VKKPMPKQPVPLWRKKLAELEMANKKRIKENYMRKIPCPHLETWEDFETHDLICSNCFYVVKPAKKDDEME